MGKRSRPVQVAPQRPGRGLLFIAVGVVALCAIAILTALMLSKQPEPPSAVAATGDAQIIMLGLKGARYTPDVITVEAGRPVTLRNDGSIRGCGLYVVQRDLGLYANFAQADEYTFTPTKRGTFTYSCSMGMYLGTMRVV